MEKLGDFCQIWCLCFFVLRQGFPVQQLCVSGCPRTCFVGQNGLKLKKIQVYLQGLKALYHTHCISFFKK